MTPGTAVAASARNVEEEAICTQAFINGAYVDSVSGEVFDVLNPATGKVIAQVAACSADDVAQATQAARAAFDSGVWAQADPAERKAVLLRLADLVEEHAQELAVLDSMDAGKPISDLLEGEVPDAVKSIRWYAELIDKAFGRVAPTGATSIGLIIREPIGVVGAVLPWNFPLAILSFKVAAILAAGCSAVVKPPELAPLSTLRFAGLAAEAGVPAGVLNVVPGLGHVAGEAVGLEMGIDAVSFTGSTEIGRKFLEYSAASNLKEVSLEMGGKSPQIIMPDMVGELDWIAEDVAGAAFYNTGENCTAGSRVLVHQDIYDDFVEALTKAAAQWAPGVPDDPNTKMGPVIEAGALANIEKAIRQAKTDGATVVFGGARVLADSGGYFHEPTVLAGVAPDLQIAQEEVFGPITAVIRFATEREAIEVANGTEYGLAATVFTRNLGCAVRLGRAIRAGTVAVNGYSEGDISTPFGGYGASGFGHRDMGVEGLQQFTQLKTIWISLQDGSSDLPVERGHGIS